MRLYTFDVDEVGETQVVAESFSEAEQKCKDFIYKRYDFVKGTPELTLEGIEKLEIGRIPNEAIS